MFHEISWRRAQQRRVLRDQSAHAFPSPRVRLPLRLSSLALKLSVIALSLSSCGLVEEERARRAWLQDAFAAEHLDLIQRAPSLVAGKLLKMRGEEESIYPYFRGSAGIYHQDLARGGDPLYSSEFLSPAGAQLWILGDPHFENLGFFCPSEEGPLRFGWNDFDGATLGPWVFDLRRLTLSGWLIGETLLERRGERGEAGDNTMPSPSALVEAIVRGYHGELARLVGAGGQGTTPIPELPWLQRELERASESRPTREAKLIRRYLKLDPAQPEELSRARFHRATLRASSSAALFDRT
ncbi:MAG: DUF2252 family protein, partial [Myxococcota bacterium]|nr:DUF2252 family protein [Myxococcota bacterium]